MSKRKNQKQNQQIIKYESKNFSQEKMIEIQAEAYYRALKRIENEKTKADKKMPERTKVKWYENLLLLLNICLWPWKINKRFPINERIYDGIPIIFVVTILRLTGILMWLGGIGNLVITIYNLFMHKIFKDIIVILCSVVVSLFGSFFIMSASTFEKETDNNKIYAYSASIIALVSCIVSIITLYKN